MDSKPQSAELAPRHRASEQQRVEPRLAPLDAPVQMRSGGAPGHADPANVLPLPDPVANLHRQRRAMQERAVEPHSVVDQQQPPLERERTGGGGLDSWLVKTADAKLSAGALKVKRELAKRPAARGIAGLPRWVARMIATASPSR